MDVFLNNTNYPQLQQNNLSEIWNKTAALKLNVSTGKSERIYPELNATFTRTASKINAAESSINLSPVSQITANFNLNVFITNELIFTAASSYYYTGQNSSASKTNVFVDSYIAYKKGKYNIELKLLNLSNIKNFRGITLSENMQAFTNYQLRPTNALIVFYLKF